MFSKFKKNLSIRDSKRKKKDKDKSLENLKIKNHSNVSNVSNLTADSQNTVESNHYFAEANKVHLAGEYDLPGAASTALTHMQTVGMAVEPFLPLFTTVTNIVDSLNVIRENAKYNEKICDALLDRVEIVQHAVKSLKRKQQENEDNFREQDYYRAWIRLINVLTSIKKFAKDVTQQTGLQKYANANALKEAFDRNIKEFESVCTDLHFTIALYSAEQREIENKQVLEDINNLGKAMSDIKDEIKGVMRILNILIKPGDAFAPAKKLLNDEHKATNIEYSALKEPNADSENIRGSQKTIIRKVYRGLDVACKKFKTENFDSLQTELTILNLLGKCPKIITFYGLSEVDKTKVMVFEWASIGNLKEFYSNSKNKIPWTAKLSFVRDIFCGLYFMHESGVLHHDVQCANILITENYEAKITNFKMSRDVQGDTTSCDNVSDYVRWLAPEKMRNERYTTKCEMFSFGMLVWELSYQKVPYANMKVKEIQNHVKSKKRETLEILSHKNPIAVEFANLIKKAWEDNPALRPSDVQVQSTIKTLCERYINGSSPLITPNANSEIDIPDLELNHQKSNGNHDFDVKTTPNKEDIPLPVINIIKPFEDGIAAHKKRNYKEAWECFNVHSGLGLSIAKYWKGYYLHSGNYVEKNLEEALKWFKMAADEGVIDAQLRYAFGLIEINKDNSKNDEILRYMKLAADAENGSAMFHLGDIYYNGKLGLSKNQEKGLNLIKLAAYKNQDDAIEFINNIKK
ncbi:hypothetical protein Glove_688g21 [Diversispora epigaea]|uniref:Protein kinase domain-containing protein n=1 Tax=Diversispora epigaea TaxID=1348612 RepID=A0A397G6E0_9GLOM|nr:hypothetical protein Glove_688g21 [Diversispora epigaea]